MGRSAATRSKPPETAGEDLDARLAAIAAEAERILAYPPEGLCQEAALELVNLSEQIAAVRIAREDALVDEFAISTAYAAGFAAGIPEGERRAAERQQVPRPRKGSHGRQGPLMRVVKGGLAAVGAGAAFRVLKGAASAHHAATAALAVAVPTAAVTAAVVIGPSHTLQNSHGYATGPDAPGVVIAGTDPGLSPRLAASVTHPKPGRVHASPSSLLLSPAPSTSPSASPSSAPSSSSPPSQGPVQGKPSWGTLTLPVTSVSITDPTRAATVTLSAGTDGDAPWTLQCRAPGGAVVGCADITFSATHGWIPAGTSQDVTLTFDQAAQQAGGSVTLMFGQGQEVTVIWLPLVPVTAPVPVPVPVVTGVVPAVTAIPSVAVTLPGL